MTCLRSRRSTICGSRPSGDEPGDLRHVLRAATGAGRGRRPAAALAGRGWKMILLATSASGAELSALRGAIDADDVILGAAGADDVDDGRPAPDPARQAGCPAGVPSERAVFVGDGLGHEGRRAGRGGPRGGAHERTWKRLPPARRTEIPPTSSDTRTPASSPTASQQGRPQSRAVDRAQRLVVQGGSAPGYRFVEARARSRTVPAPVCGGHAQVAMSQAFPDDGAYSRTARTDS